MWHDKVLQTFNCGITSFQTVFHTAVPYRVSQKLFDPDYIILLRDCDDNFDTKAPKSLAAKDGPTILSSSNPGGIQSLTYGDKIFVKQYRSKNSSLSSPTKLLIEKVGERFLIDFNGIAILAEHDSSLIRCYDFSYISRMDGSGRYWITDRKCFDQKELKIKSSDGIPKESQKLGARLRCTYIKFPKNCFHHSGSSLHILPSVLKHCHLYSSSILKPEKQSSEKDFLISVSPVEALENPTDLKNDLICLYTCLYCIFTKDKIEKIEKVSLFWKFSDTSAYSQVTYKSQKDIITGSDGRGEQSHNYVNSLFTRYSTAILKRHNPDESEDDRNNVEDSKEIHVKINRAIFKEHEVIIGFKVKVEDVLKEWNLQSTRDLVIAKYSLEPTDIFAHWRPFIEKLVDEDDLLGSILKDSNSPRTKIMEAFMPVKPEQEVMQICQQPSSISSTSNNPQNNQRGKATKGKGKGKKKQLKAKPKPAKPENPPVLTKSKIFEINQRLNATAEASHDKFLQPGQIPHAHILAHIEVIKKCKPLVIIDGGPQSGKTTFYSSILPSILDANLQIECDEISKSLVLVAPSMKTLRVQLKLIQENEKYQSIQIFVRILNLIDFNEEKPGTFMAVLKKVVKEYNPTEEDKEKLITGMELLKTKFCAFHHENETGYERDIIMPELTKEEKQALRDSTDTCIDLITSKELLIFQDAIKVIFAYYRPNFIIATNETFISLLPSMSAYISHIAIDEAGRVSFIEVLNMIVECPILEQLILNGDTTTYPYYHRIRLEQRPYCFDNVMKRIILYSPELTYIQLNKSMGMHPGILGVVKDVFYPDRNLIPLFPPVPLLLNLFQNPDIPISFHDVDEVDEYVPPTTRKNFYQNYIAMKLIQKIISTDELFRSLPTVFQQGGSIPTAKSEKMTKSRIHAVFQQSSNSEEECLTV